MNCTMSFDHLGTTVVTDADPRTQHMMVGTLTGLKERGLISVSVAVAVLPILHMLAHIAVRTCSKGNYSISEDQRVVASHHVVEFILGLVMFPLMLQVTLRLMLCHPAETYSSSVVDFGLAASAAVCAMYSAELAARSSKTRPLTAIHHLLTIAFLITVVVETNELINAVGALFITGALAEAPLFAGLLMYRFKAGRERAAWWVLLFGIATYGVSRVAQLVAHVTLLGAFDLGQFPAATLFWAVGGAGVLHVIQLHTFVIYRSILRKVMPTKGRSARSFRPSKELLFPTGHTQEIDMREMRDAENVDQLGTNAIANLPRVESINTDLGSSFHSSLSPISSFHRRPSLNGSPNDDSNHSLTSEPRTGLTNVVSGEHVIDMPALREAFVTAASQAKSLDVVSNADKLRLYALYKQATVGAAPSEYGGSSFNVVAARKWEAWAAVRQLQYEEAMRSYCELVESLSGTSFPPTAAISKRRESVLPFPTRPPPPLEQLASLSGGAAFKAVPPFHPSVLAPASLPPITNPSLTTTSFTNAPFTSSSPSTRARPLRILSLDGGGCKGLSTIQVLQALEKACGQPLNEMFDYVGGVSVGGAIGLSVAREPYSMGKITDFLEQVRTAGPERLIICSPFLLLFFEAKPQLPAILSLSPPSPFSYPGGSPPRTSQPRRAALSARIVLATRQGRLQSER